MHDTLPTTDTTQPTELTPTTMLNDGVTVYDPATWLFKKDAARYVGTTERSIERYASKGKLRPLMWKQTPNRPLAVYAKQELDRLKGDNADKTTPTVRQPDPPRQVAVGHQNGHVLLPVTPTATAPVASPLSGLPILISASFLAKHGTYVDLDTAKKLTGLPPSGIKLAVEEGRVQKWPKRRLYRTVDLLQL